MEKQVFALRHLQVIVRCWNNTVHSVVDKGKIVGMIPIREHDWANINIIIGRFRTMDDYRT